MKIIGLEETIRSLGFLSDMQGRDGGQVAQESEGDKQKDSPYESLMVKMMKSGAEMRSFLKIRFHIQGTTWNAEGHRPCA